MAETLYIGNDILAAKTEILFSEQQFVNLVDQYMGSDAAKYLERCLQSTGDDMREHEREVQDAYDAGYEHGLMDGHDGGYDEGMEDGRNLGYHKGYTDGFDKGVESGILLVNP